MITEFDSIFHENGFIFVNEMKKDIEAQMAGRVEGQRNASKMGHTYSKGIIRKTRKDSGYVKTGGFKTGGADACNTAVDPDTGKGTKVPKQYHNDKEAVKQKNRAEKKGIKKESALMESIELI